MCIRDRAGAVPMQPDRAAARARLGIDQDARVLAILPGSRSSEIRLLAPRFLQAAQMLQKRCLLYTSRCV